MNEARQLGGKRASGKAQREKRADFVFREKVERELTCNAFRLKIELEREKRMLRELKLRRPERDDRQEPVIAESREHVREEIDCRSVCPVNVLDEQDERIRVRDVGDESGQLALESFLRRRRWSCSGTRVERGDLSSPGWRVSVERSVNQPRRIILEEVLERVEHGQVSFGAGKPLRASAASDKVRRPALKLVEKILNQSRLSNAGLAGYADHGGVARYRGREFIAQRRFLELASDCLPASLHSN